MANEPIVSIASRINYAMSLKGYNQVELAKKTKIGIGSINQYVLGKVSPKQDRIYLLAEALDVSEEWLMGFDVPMVRVKKDIDRTKLDDQAKRLLAYYDALNPTKRDLVMQILENLQ